MGERGDAGSTGPTHRLACMRDSIENIQETMRTINKIIQRAPCSRLASLLEIQEQLAVTSLQLQEMMQHESASARFLFKKDSQ